MPRTASPHALALAAAFAAAGLFPSVGRPAQDAPLRVSGTGSALGTMRALAAAFAKASPGDKLELLPSVGTSGALKAVAAGALDLGLAGRPLEPAESTLGLSALPYGRTPFVFAAGPRVGASGITAAEVARMYRGELTEWPNGERVRVVLRPKADADTALLRSFSHELAEAVDIALAREGMLMAATNQECDAMLARTPGAVGPTSLTQIVAEDERVTPLAWEGVQPTLANLASGAYQLSKTHYVVFKASPRPAVRRFLAFLGSPEARRIVEQTGNLPLALPALLE